MGDLAGQSTLLLRKQLSDLRKNPVAGFSAGLIDDSDIYKWEVLIIGPPDTLYEGGFFKAHLVFPKEYPQRPPKMTFVSEIWHPNIDKNGDVCISILHEPGDDKWGKISNFVCFTEHSVIFLCHERFQDMRRRRSVGCPFTRWRQSFFR